MKQSPIWFWDLHNYLTINLVGSITAVRFAAMSDILFSEYSAQQLPYGPN